MKENNKRSLVLVIIAIATLILIVGAATFAFFATGRDLANGNLNASVGTAASMYQFSATSNGKIEMDILFNEMSEANISTEKIKTDNATIDVSLASPSENMLTTCTYDIVWVWDDGDIYTTPDVALPYTHTDDEKHNYEFSAEVDTNGENDLSKLPVKDNKIILQQGASMKSNSTSPSKKTYTITASIYNMPVDQPNLFNKSFNAHITIDNLNCKMTDTTKLKVNSLAEYIKTIDYEGEGINGLYFHDGEGTYTNANLEAGDNTYRYAGANPNNYICFQGDDCTNENNLYRIISIDESNRIKVVKATSVESMSWNEKTGYLAKEGDNILNAGTTYANIWAIDNGDGTYYTSSLNDYLNGEYLESLDTKSDLMEETIWSVGGVDDNTKETQNIKAVHTLELNNSITSKSKIGLIYTSDYGYAATPDYWNFILYSNSGGKQDYSLSKGNNWLWSKDISWTLTRSLNINTGALAIYSRGTVNRRDITSKYTIYPAFVLKPSVKRATGLGSKENPYVIYDNPSLALYIKRDVYSDDGVNDLYYHDGQGTYTNANLEAGDNSYRYSGTNPNNYVCFQEDTEEDGTCIDDNLYRIIGVIDNNVKLIKHTKDGNKNWNEKDGYTASGTTYDTAMGLTSGTTYTNIWAIRQSDGSYYTSSLNDYLNGEYLINLGDKSNLIEETTWRVGGTNSFNRTSSKVIMQQELNENVTYNAKIGLVYLSEYGYAALPENWSSIGSVNDWLLHNTMWPITRRTGDSVWVIESSLGTSSYGSIGGKANLQIYPTFNLKSSVEILNANAEGVGSKNTPMIIG